MVQPGDARLLATHFVGQPFQADRFTGLDSRWAVRVRLESLTYKSRGKASVRNEL
jgi:hypothetical protein